MCIEFEKLWWVFIWVVCSAEFPRRSSVGIRESGGGSYRDIMEDKENGKDQILKPAKVRSPAASSKSTKNFMSPTISASCKFAESPRKKVLAERNEPSPTTCIPSSDPKSHVRKVTFADPLEEKRSENGFPGPTFEETCEDLSVETLHDANVPLINDAHLSFEPIHVHDMNVPLIPKNDADLSFETVHVHDHDVNVPLILENDIHTETVIQEPDFVNLDPTFKLSPTATPPVSSTATILAPLDADPLMPPYDPKTNYLSPRPQFLHYKPRPRMELGNERELEDGFMSGSFSDTEVTEDTQSEGSQKESEDGSSDEIVKQEEDQISEPSSPGNLVPEKTVEAKEVPKPRFSVRSKAIAFILLLSVAFVSISVIDSPGIDHTVFDDFYEAYKSSEFSEFAWANFERFSYIAKANFHGLARNLHIWFTKSLSSISELISNAGGAHNLAQLQYFNLTVLQDYTVVSEYPIFGRGENEICVTHLPVQESYAASEIGTEEYIEDISAEYYEVYEEQLQQDMGITTGVENASDAPESEEVLKGQPATLVESEQALQLAEVENLDAKVAQEVDASFNVVEDASESEEVLEGQSATESEQALQLVEAGDSEENQTQRDGDDSSNIDNKPSLNSEAAEIHNEVCGENTEQAQENDAKLNGEDLKHLPGSESDDTEIHSAMYDDDNKAEGKSASIDAAIRGNEQQSEAIHIPPRMVLYLLLCAGTVFIAGAAFNWSRKVKSRSNKINSSVEKPRTGGEEVHAKSLISSQNKQNNLMNNGPTEEMDVLEEPCPSEMSSFEKSSSSYSRRAKQLNEANSVDKKRKTNSHRRESLASSSDYSLGSSPSYGSLTVYEKIPRVSSVVLSCKLLSMCFIILFISLINCYHC